MKFPSPCGVLVLKWQNGLLYTYVTGGFRPLAGFWFLNPPPMTRYRDANRVSVPLRGSGS